MADLRLALGRPLTLFTSLIAVVMLLAACGVDADNDEDVGVDEGDPIEDPDPDTDEPVAEDDAWDAGAPDEWEEILEAARQEEGRVVVAGPPWLGDPLAEAFEADTGIPMDYVGGSSGDISARMERETRAGDLTIDIMLGGGAELLTLKPDGLLEPLPPQLILPNATDPENWGRGELLWYDDEEQYLLITSQWVFGWPIVNADIIDPDEIRVWDDLLKPEFEGQIAAHDPRGPGPGQGATGFMVSQLGLDYLDDLLLGQDVTFTDDNGQLVEWVARGTYPIALFALQGNVERFSEDFNIEVILPEDEPGYVTSGFSVVKQAQGVPHPNAGQVFLNWFASSAGQEAYERIMLETSARVDVHVDGLPDYVRPQEGVDYWLGDSDEQFYIEGRREAIERLTELLGGA